jgi:hypothetical protein
MAPWITAARCDPFIDMRRQQVQQLQPQDDMAALHNSPQHMAAWLHVAHGEAHEVAALETLHGPRQVTAGGVDGDHCSSIQHRHITMFSYCCLRKPRCICTKRARAGSSYHLPASSLQLAQYQLLLLPLLPRVKCSPLRATHPANCSHALQDTTVNGAISCSPSTMRRSNICTANATRDVSACMYSGCSSAANASQQSFGLSLLLHSRSGSCCCCHAAMCSGTTRAAVAAVLVTPAALPHQCIHACRCQQLLFLHCHSSPGPIAVERMAAAVQSK